MARDRKSTRLNSSHVKISYAVFCLKKKKQPTATRPINATGSVSKSNGTFNRVSQTKADNPNAAAKDNVTVISTMTVFFFNDTATTEIYTLSLHDALPI